jgi:hypothetical protein
LGAGVQEFWPRALIRPPLRLRQLPAAWVRLLRPLWILAFLVAIGAVMAGTILALRDTFEVRPAFTALGLDYDVESNGEISVQLDPRRASASLTDRPFRIVAINGTPIAADARSPDLARVLIAAPGTSVALDLRSPDGKLVRVQPRRDPAVASPSAQRARALRTAMRLTSGLLACGALLLCSLLLARRRPDDPVALLFAFAFAGMAATIDPPLAMWMAMGWPAAYDVISSAWFYLLLIALAVFPDGIFVPKTYRWLLPLGIPLAIFVSLPNVDANLQVFVGIGALLAMLVGQVRRFRRLGPGIERQQIKWAAFGFGAGLLLVLAAFVLLAMQPQSSTAQSIVVNLIIVLLFSLGMAVIPLGLLVALTRYRLWEADTVISRSAAYAVVTVVVGVVWAASSDLVKMIVEQVIGRESQAGATTLSAIIAAGVFAPTQSVVLGWTKRRFGSPVERIHEAAHRLKSWGMTEPPAEVATRALAIIDQAIHPAASAIVLDTALSHELIAARDVSSADDPRLVERLTLADEESSVGTLLLGRRSDGNRYNRLELEAVQEIIPPLADALRVARSRYSRDNMMQQRLDEMAARLAQLEGGGAAKPA